MPNIGETLGHLIGTKEKLVSQYCTVHFMSCADSGLDPACEDVSKGKYINYPGILKFVRENAEKFVFVK